MPAAVASYVLRALAATRTTPPTSARPARIGGIGTVSLSSAVASIGPTSSTFSFVREGESAQGEPHHAEHDQEESDDRAGLHTGAGPG